mmetsp:Transcript_1341/g.1817  ORF Transcript_1341/g.1817 Transcript_1341/m.1817 type:complete len:201 (+) Transcript_1341:520-1122(+)
MVSSGSIFNPSLSLRASRVAEDAPSNPHSLPGAPTATFVSSPFLPLRRRCAASFIASTCTSFKKRINARFSAPESVVSLKTSLRLLAIGSATPSRTTYVFSIALNSIYLCAVESTMHSTNSSAPSTTLGALMSMEYPRVQLEPSPLKLPLPIASRPLGVRHPVDASTPDPNTRTGCVLCSGASNARETSALARKLPKFAP